MGIFPHLLRSSKRDCLLQSRRNSSSAKVPQRHPPPTTYPDARPLSYSGGFVQPAPFFRKLVPVITVDSPHYFTPFHHRRGNYINLNALHICRDLAGCIFTIFNHQPTLNNTICATSRPQTPTICMQKNKGEITNNTWVSLQRRQLKMCKEGGPVKLIDEWVWLL